MHLDVGVCSLDVGGDDVPDTNLLVLRIRQGDRAAETELVTRYRDWLRVMLRRHVKEVARAEDLCQDVLRIALPALREGRLRDGHRLTAYLWGIARNLASHHRRLRSHEGTEVQVAALADPSPDAEDQCARAERAALLRRALDRLSARDRDVLRAFYLTGLSKTAICSRYAFSPPQFDVIKHRALRRLAAALSARGVERV